MLREHPWPALLVAAAESNTTHDTRQSNEADHPRRPAGAVPGALGLRGREAGGWRRMSAVLGFLGARRDEAVADTHIILLAGAGGSDYGSAPSQMYQSTARKYQQ